MSSRATATATSMPQAQAAPMAPVMMIPKERIAMRAYEKWLKGGCRHGRDQQDWIEAEKELRAEMAKAPASPGRR
jgi:hypothetical protein